MDIERLETGDSISKILRESNSDVLAAAQQAIMEKVLLATVQEALHALGSPAAIAEQALSYVDASHPVLTQAQDALQAKLVQEVAARATTALAPDEVVAAARPQVDEQPLVTAVDALKAQLVEEIARQTTDALSDTEAMVEEASAYLDEAHEALLQAVDALKKQILRTIVNDSLEQINSEVGGRPGDTPTPLRPSEQGPARRNATMVAVPLVKADAPPSPASTPEATLTGSRRQQKRVANGYPLLEETITEGDFMAETSALLEDVVDTGYYVYGLVASTCTLDPATLTGFDAAYPLEQVACGTLTALVSEIPLYTVGADAEDETWLERSKRVHDTLCRQIDDAGYAILPLRSPQTCASKAVLEATLKTHHDELAEALQHITGRQEWSVKIYCDVIKIWESMLEDEKEVHAFLSNIDDMVELLGENGIKLDGEAEIEAFKTGMAVEVEDMIASIFSYCKVRSHDVLHKIAADSLLTPPADGQVFGAGTMILGASYLVATDQGQHFRSVLETMAEEHKKLGFSYYIGGPYFAYQYAAEKAPLL